MHLKLGINIYDIYIDRGEAEVDIGFREVTISHVTLLCRQSLYYTE